MNVKIFLSFAWSRPATYDLKVKNKSEYLQVLKAQSVILQVKSESEIFQRAKERYFCLFPKKQHIPISKVWVKSHLVSAIGKQDRRMEEAADSEERSAQKIWIH